MDYIVRGAGEPTFDGTYGTPTPAVVASVTAYWGANSVVKTNDDGTHCLVISTNNQQTVIIGNNGAHYSLQGMNPLLGQFDAVNTGVAPGPIVIEQPEKLTVNSGGSAVALYTTITQPTTPYDPGDDSWSISRPDGSFIVPATPNPAPGASSTSAGYTLSFDTVQPVTGPAFSSLSADASLSISEPNLQVVVNHTASNSNGYPTRAIVDFIATATTNGNPSNIVAVRPGTPAGNITNLVGFALDGGALLRWLNPALLGGVMIQRRLQVPAGNALDLWQDYAHLTALVPGNPATVPNSHALYGLTNGTVYEFQVYATP